MFVCDVIYQGLRELYHFKQRYPEFDLNEFMKDNSKIYQSYVQRGLKSVEAEMMGQGVCVCVGGGGGGNQGVHK